MATALVAACGPKIPAESPRQQQTEPAPDDDPSFNPLDEGRRAHDERVQEREQQPKSSSTPEAQDRIGRNCPKPYAACFDGYVCAVGADGCQHCQCKKSGILNGVKQSGPQDDRMPGNDPEIPR
jgi:hypothetical protein